MDCAANFNHAKLIQLLIDCNAPIDAKDRSLVCSVNVHVIAKITGHIVLE